MNSEPTPGYIRLAIESAAAALLWQAADASENGGHGFPLGEDDSGRLQGETQYVSQVIEQVPYLTEAVTSFVTGSWALLQRGHVRAAQCGHDLILTANRHGAGFWDRGLDMPAGDDEAYTAWRAARRQPYPQSRTAWTAWLAEHRPYPGDHPQTVGEALTADAHGYSFEAEFALDDDGDVAWLMVENTVLVDDLGWDTDDGEPEMDDETRDAMFPHDETPALDPPWWKYR